MPSKDTTHDPGDGNPLSPLLPPSFIDRTYGSHKKLHLMKHLKNDLFIVSNSYNLPVLNVLL